MWFIESMIVNPKWTSFMPFEPTASDIYGLMRRQMELNNLELDIPSCFPTPNMLITGVKILKTDRTDVIHYVHKKEQCGGVCFQVNTTWGDDVIFVSHLLYEVLAVRREISKLYGVWYPKCKSKLRFHGVIYDSIGDAAEALKIPIGTFARKISEYRNLIKPWPLESSSVLSNS